MTPSPLEVFSTLIQNVGKKILFSGNGFRFLIVGLAMSLIACDKIPFLKKEKSPEEIHYNSELNNDEEKQSSLAEKEGAFSCQSDEGHQCTIPNDKNSISSPGIEKPSLPSPIVDQGKVSAPIKSHSVLVASGTIMSPRSGNLAFRATGLISHVYKLVGQSIKKGEVLAIIDNTYAQFDLKLAEEELKLSEIQMEQTKREFEREKKLKNQKVTSLASYEGMKVQFDSDKIRSELAKTKRDVADKRLSDTKLVAPYDGIVSARFKNEGEFVTDGVAVFEIFETGNLEVHFNVPESFLSKIKIGAVLPLSLPSQSLSGQVTIVRIVPYVSEKSRTFKVIGTPKISGAKLAPGQFVETEF